MTKKDLVKIIREVVKREVKAAVTNEINEVLTSMEQSKKREPISEKTYTKNSMLNEILNETAQNYNDESEWPEISAQSLRAKFSGMQGGTAPMTDVNNRPVDTSKLDPSLNKALSRDYSELVKRFKK
tara:strand:- start:4570 stop:4950 length:381 start_codon:yes stop_codon:yes gene_type:complete